jgi:hypothetical protein
MWHRTFAIFGLLILAAGCASIHAPTPGAQAVPIVAPSNVPGDLPCVQTSRSCVPLNPDVTQDTIRQTICVSGYTKAVRPSSSYANGVKAKLLRESGIDESHMPDYELDHIVPLSLGGHPRKLGNLALQPWEGEHGAIRKDLLSAGCKSWCAASISA